MLEESITASSFTISPDAHLQIRSSTESVRNIANERIEYLNQLVQQRDLDTEKRQTELKHKNSEIEKMTIKAINGVITCLLIALSYYYG